MLLLIAGLLSARAEVAPARLPNPFPAAATYTAHLRTTSRSKLCATCTFDGEHHYNSDPSRLYGHVAWYYGPSNRTAAFINFLDVFLGAKQQMFLVSEQPPAKGQAEVRAPAEAQCTLIEPYPAPIFNHSWAAGAAYVGTRWFHQRLCREWTGVYPYFIQGEVRVSRYFEDVFTGLPAGFINEVEEFWYDVTTFSTATPADSLFTEVAALNCSSPP